MRGFGMGGHAKAHDATMNGMANSTNLRIRRHLVWHHNCGSVILVAERIPPRGRADAGAEALVGVFHPGQRYMPSRADLGSEVSPTDLDDDALLSSATAQLAEYFAGRRRVFDLPLAPERMTPRTDFRRGVWQALQDIPYGKVTTYGELASAIGKPNSAQAVGQAVGRNPLSILVPCHRVVGADGSLTGYAGGIDRKIFLLQVEGVNIRGLDLKRQP